MESIELMIADIFEEAWVNLSRTEVPSALTLLLTTVKRVMVLLRYWILKAAFRILLSVKLKEADEILEDGWI
jgi:hypothetical protein